ncbi:MAG: hypothetical protein ACKOTB_14005 [Planctomycetia bacterium]
MHEIPPEARGNGGGFPAYVRGWCCKARDRTLARGYRDVGYLLAAKLRRFRPPGLSPRRWRRNLGRLRRLLEQDDERAALCWFTETYPELVAMIPVGERWRFVAGVRDRRGA